jgi:hypothetical protein
MKRLLRSKLSICGEVVTAIAVVGVIGWLLINARSHSPVPVIPSPSSERTIATRSDIQSQMPITAKSVIDSLQDVNQLEIDHEPPPATAHPDLTKSETVRSWAPASRERKRKIGFEKKLEIRISSRTVEVGPTVAVVAVTNDELTQANIDDVLAGIDRAVWTWDEPPANFCWVPRTDFIVKPGGEGNCERLRRLLKDGFDVESTVRLAVDVQDDGEPEHLFSPKAMAIHRNLGVD